MRISPLFKRILATISVLLFLAATYFFSIKSADQGRLTEAYEPKPRQQNQSPQKLDSYFIRDARFLLRMPLVTGDTALAYCDTGGGLSMILPNTVERYELGNYLSYGILRGLMPLQFGLADHLITDPDLADFDVLQHFSVRTPFQAVSKPFFVVPPNDGEVKKKQEVMPEVELFLGQNFFMGRSWTFDYPSNEVWVHTPLPSSLQSEGNVLPLGFKKNPHGQPIYAHPSMPIVVDGTTIDVLFDTGASFVMSDSTKRALGESENTLAGSFIAASVFEQWQQDHPEWPVSQYGRKRRRD